MEIKKEADKNERIKTFDFVRAAATLSVFLFHAGYLLSYTKTGFINWGRLEYFSGTVGVSAFFVLSGFLLFYQMAKDNKPLDAERLKYYVKKRALRILPLYYFSLFFIVLVLQRDILWASDGLRSIVYNLLFIRGPFGGGGITINSVYWTLIVELHFYILLPVFYYIFYKYKKISLFFLLILLGFIYRTAVVFFLHHPNMQLLRLIPANFDFFALGMLGACLYLRHGKWVNYLGKGYIQLFFLVALVLFVNFYDLDFYPTVAYIFAPALLGTIIVLGMLSFLFNEQTFLAKLATSAPMLFVAKISFSVYIWHTIVIGRVANSFAVSNGAKFILSLIFTLAVSTVSYYLIEEPFLKVKLKSARAA